MDIALKFFSIFLVICFARQAFGVLCGPNQILIYQSNTGKAVEGKPEYQVTVNNTCSCPQSQVIVNCSGFNSVEPVDPNIIKPLDKERCIVNNGNAIAPGVPIRFKYASAVSQNFPVLSLKNLCD